MITETCDHHHGTCPTVEDLRAYRNRCTCLVIDPDGPNWQHTPSCPQNAANEGDA